MRGRAVPHQKDALTCGSVLFGELIEKELHTMGVESREHEPEDAPCAGMHSRKEPEPLVALIHFGKRSRSNWCPHPPDNRLEAKARFVLAPDFDFLPRTRPFEGSCLTPQLFLKAACSAGEARRLF
jgi:hypothetical protein